MEEQGKRFNQSADIQASITKTISNIAALKPATAIGNAIGNTVGATIANANPPAAECESCPKGFPTAFAANMKPLTAKSKNMFEINLGYGLGKNANIGMGIIGNSGRGVGYSYNFNIGNNYTGKISATTMVWNNGRFSDLKNNFDANYSIPFGIPKVEDPEMINFWGQKFNLYEIKRDFIDMANSTSA